MPSVLIPVTSNLDDGLVKDLPPTKLSPSSWTHVQNVSFDNGVVRKAKGYTKALTPTVAPYFIMASPDLSLEFWLYAGLEKVYGFLGMTQADITRASGDYTGSIQDLWNGGLLHGVPFINNGKDLPQSWGTPSLSSPLIDMPAWPATQTAKVVRAYKSYLVALDVTKAGVRDGRMVKWSASAPPGSLPGSWDETDATKDAGEQTLPQGSDGLVDGVELEDVLVLYTRRSTWAMEFIGGEFIFRFRRLFADSGMLAQDCAVPWRNRHFVVTQNDIILHDGTNFDSIADSKVRNWLFDNLNDSASVLTKVKLNPIDNEIWIAFPSGSSFTLDKALIWNWRSNSWTLRDLPDIRAIATSVRNPFVSPDVWDLASGDWDSDTSPWNPVGLTTTPLENVLLLAPPDLSGIFLVGNEFQFDGSNYVSRVERRGISVIATREEEFVPVDSTVPARVIQDMDRHRMGLSVKPLLDAAPGTKVFISFGSHETQLGVINWKGPVPFTVGRDKKIDLYPSGKFLALRIEDKGNVGWKLTGYVIEVASMGRY